jgi:hypothetical protein
VDGDAAFIHLAGGTEHAQAQAGRHGHFFLLAGLSTMLEVISPVRFSARFSLIDLPDFFDADCRGDLSPMSAP